MPKNTDHPEMTRKQMAGGMRFKDLPPSVQAKWNAIQETAKRRRGERGPQKAPTKQLVSMRLSPDVLAAMRATGRGWQSAADEALRERFVKHG